MNHPVKSGYLALFAAAAVALAGCASMEDFATNPERRRRARAPGTERLLARSSDC